VVEIFLLLKRFYFADAIELIKFWSGSLRTIASNPLPNHNDGFPRFSTQEALYQLNIA
jgi:hypothetical protein